MQRINLPIFFLKIKKTAFIVIKSQQKAVFRCSKAEESLHVNLLVRAKYTNSFKGEKVQYLSPKVH